MKEQTNYTTIDTPLGMLFLGASLNGVSIIRFMKNRSDLDVLNKDLQLEKVESHHSIFYKLVSEIDLYFSGQLKNFSVKLDIKGTDFQKRVWRKLLDIPFGETTSYSHIAQKIGNAKASRAVGQANNKNNLPIIIPCHRIVGKNGSLIGYAGGLFIKKWLLNHERTHNKIS